jgi:hypothetical protein
LIKRRALSCILSSFIAFEQKCQAKGQKLKLDNKRMKICSLIKLGKPTQINFELLLLARKLMQKNLFFNIESANISCDEVIKLS